MTSQKSKETDESSSVLSRLGIKLIEWGALIYYLVRGFFYNLNFKKKHLSFRVSKGKLQIISLDHADFIEMAQMKLNKLSNKNQSVFIKEALKLALEGCNFIIFSPKDDENKFIQFWTGDHKLKFNFYANKTNRLKKYYLAIIGLLSESGFVNSEIENYRGSMVYHLEKGQSFISIDVNFRHDINQASQVATAIFNSIYQLKGSKIVAKVE